MMNIPKSRSAKIDASARLARSSEELMRALEFTAKGEWSRAKGLRYISRLPYGNDPGSRRAHAQLEECQPGHSTRPPRRDYGLVGLGQVVARVRHPVCRRPAPLRRIALRLRAPVPRADGEAGRGPHRGPVAGHRHRAEG